MNDEIDTASCSVSYATFEDAIVKIQSFGVGALMAKADIKSAFRLLPISPEAFSSLGFHFEDCFFFDKCLPMGYSLSCSYFEMFSTFLHWVVNCQSGKDSVIHYLDDFLFVGPPDSNICLDLLQIFRGITQDFGVPLVEEKSCLPTSSLEFLGIYIDTHRREFCLPEAKLAKLKTLLALFLQKKKVILKDMQSLLGNLAFACRIMPVGRIFSRRFYLFISGLKSPFAHF